MIFFLCRWSGQATSCVRSATVITPASNNWTRTTRVTTRPEEEKQAKVEYSRTKRGGFRANSATKLSRIAKVFTCIRGGCTVTSPDECERITKARFPAQFVGNSSQMLITWKLTLKQFTNPSKKQFMSETIKSITCSLPIIFFYEWVRLTRSMYMYLYMYPKEWMKHIHVVLKSFFVNLWRINEDAACASFFESIRVISYRSLREYSCLKVALKLTCRS